MTQRTDKQLLGKIVLLVAVVFCFIPVVLKHSSVRQSSPVTSSTASKQSVITPSPCESKTVPAIAKLRENEHSKIVEFTPRSRYGIWPNARLASKLLLNFFPVKFIAQKLNICTIPKNCRTEMLQLFETYTTGHQPRANASAWDGFRNVYKWFKMPENQVHKKLMNTEVKEDWHRLVVLRDPFDRFISAFLHLCVLEEQLGMPTCRYCKDFRCFIHKNLNYIKNVSKYHTWTENQDGHFFPQSWFCGFPFDRSTKYEFVIYGSGGLRNFGHFMRKRIFELGLKDEEKNAGFFKELPVHTTKAMPEKDAASRLLLDNPKNFQAFYDTYRVDYENFGFNLPKEVERFCENDDDSWNFCEVLKM